MNYAFQRSNVEDVIVLVTTRSLQDRPVWDSDVTRAKNEIQMYAQIGIQVVTLALGRQRFRISMQMQQITSFREPIILSGFKKLGGNNDKELEVMQGLCPLVTEKPGGPRAPAPDCSREPHDIFFVVDGSASIKTRNFVYVRKFLMDLLSLLRIGISNINIGMLQFSEVRKTEILMDLDKYSLEHQMRVVDTMVYQRGKRTMTGNALTMVANQVFNGDPENGDRPGVKDVLIIFTDGNAHDIRVALEQAEVIKSRGVRVITIGAGTKRSIWKFQDELKKMCTDPKRDFIMVDFEDLSGFANEAFPLICKEQNKKKL